MLPGLTLSITAHPCFPWWSERCSLEYRSHTNNILIIWEEGSFYLQSCSGRSGPCACHKVFPSLCCILGTTTSNFTNFSSWKIHKRFMLCLQFLYTRTQHGNFIIPIIQIYLLKYTLRHQIQCALNKLSNQLQWIIFHLRSLLLPSSLSQMDDSNNF